MNEGGRLLRAVKVPSKILDVPLNRETLTTSRYCFPEVLNVKVSSSLGYFMHGGADEKPENVTCQDMATADYLECCHLQRPGKGPYYYFTSPLNSPSLSAFSNVTNRRWWLKTKHFFPSPSALLPSIWIGGLGTDTRTHYDLRDNFLFNAYGRKRVRVWSPRSCFENFVMFPGWFFLLLLLFLFLLFMFQFACPCLSGGQARLVLRRKANVSHRHSSSRRLFASFSPDSSPYTRKVQSSSSPPSSSGSLSPPLLDVVIDENAGIVIPAFYPHHCVVLPPEQPASGQCDFSASITLNVFSRSDSVAKAERMLQDVAKMPDHFPAQAVKMLQETCPAFEVFVVSECIRRYNRLLQNSDDGLDTESEGPPSKALTQYVEGMSSVGEGDCYESDDDIDDTLSSMSINLLVSCHMLEMCAVLHSGGNRQSQVILDYLESVQSNLLNGR